MGRFEKEMTEGQIILYLKISNIFLLAFNWLILFFYYRSQKTWRLVCNHNLKLLETLLRKLEEIKEAKRQIN